LGGKNIFIPSAFVAYFNTENWLKSIRVGLNSYIALPLNGIFHCQIYTLLIKSNKRNKNEHFQKNQFT
jgi:hypothetical protein